MSNSGSKCMIVSTLRRIARLAAAAFALTILASCMVGPDYVRPAAETPVSYKETEGWRKAEPRDGVIRGEWWEIFNDPFLNEMEEKVNISNQNIAAAEAQFRQARALARAAGSALFPVVTANASVIRSRRSSTVGGGGLISSTGETSSDFRMAGGASWEADVWGKIRRGVEAAEAGAQASSADLAAIRLSVQAELAQDYFQLRALDAQRKFLDETVDAFEKSLSLTKNRYAHGVASKADVLQAETLLQSTRAQAIDIGVQRSQMEHAIAALLGRPASAFSITVAPLTAIPPSVPVGVPSELLERRPDIAAAERRVAAANAQIGVAQAAFYPDITLSASGGFESSRIADWLNWPSRFWAVGAAIAETVFEGGLRRALSDQARAAYDATVASYRQTVLTAFQEVEDNLAALRILEQEGRVQDEAVRAARQLLAVSTNQYKAGTVSYLDVIIAQTATLNNERTAIVIQGRRMVASVLLVQALGGGWQTPVKGAAAARASASSADKQE